MPSADDVFFSYYMYFIIDFILRSLYNDPILAHEGRFLETILKAE